MRSSRARVCASACPQMPPRYPRRCGDKSVRGRSSDFHPASFVLHHGRAGRHRGTELDARPVQQLRCAPAIRIDCRRIALRVRRQRDHRDPRAPSRSKPRSPSPTSDLIPLRLSCAKLVAVRGELCARHHCRFSRRRPSLGSMRRVIAAEVRVCHAALYLSKVTSASHILCAARRS